MTTAPRIVASALVLLATSRIAAAERDIVIETPGERSTNTKIFLAAVAGASVIVGGIGVYFHFDSQSAADDVSAAKFTGQAWTSEDIALADQADRSKTRAVVAYSIGGGLLIGAVVAFIATDPGSETIVITPSRSRTTLAPTAGGAVVGRMWSF